MPFSEEPDASELPCAEALVAGTVALMTTWADPCPHCTLPTAEQRALMARKIVSNLFFLEQHPGLSPGLRHVMGHAHRRWVGLARSPGAAVSETATETAADLPTDVQTEVQTTGPSPAAMALH